MTNAVGMSDPQIDARQTPEPPDRKSKDPGRNPRQPEGEPDEPRRRPINQNQTAPIPLANRKSSEHSS